MNTLLRSTSARTWCAIFSALAALAVSQAAPAQAQTAATESSSVTLSERRAAEAFQANTRRNIARWRCTSRL